MGASPNRVEMKSTTSSGVPTEFSSGAEVSPVAVGDLGDGDNNHELCLDTEARVIRVEFPAGLLTDPREDLNPATVVYLGG